MLKNNNLSYTAQNHSSVTILNHFVNGWQMNITAEFELSSMIHSRDIKHHNINIETSLVRSFKHDDNNKSCIS